MMIHSDTNKDTQSDSVNAEPQNSPPSYESAINYDTQPCAKPAASYGPVPPPDSEALPLINPASTSLVTSSTATVYHYQHPITGHVVTSILPPDHPEMICLQEGQHITESKFGFVGILAAIFWFPLGIGLCLLDRRVACTRCGKVVNNGLTC